MRPRSGTHSWIMCVGFVLTALAPPSAALQEVKLDFPDSVDLKVVVDYVSATLGLNILYEEEALQNKRVSLRVAGPVARETLPGILRSVLRSRGLALVEAEQPGWLKIVPAERLAIEAGLPRAELSSQPGAEAEVLTYVLRVAHGDLQRIQTAITPYLSKPGGTLVVAPESRALVITDYQRNVRRALELAALLDVESGGASIETIPVQHQDVAELASLVGRLLAERERVEAPGGAPTLRPNLSLQPDPVSGGLIAIGPVDQVAAARRLIERLDVPVQRRTEFYQPRFITASRLKGLIEQLIGGGLKLAADDAANTLLVIARPEDHARVGALLERFDTSAPAAATPLRFYRLLNRRAADVFATLGGLLGGEAVNETSSAAPSAATSGRRTGESRAPGGPGAERTAIVPLPPPVGDAQSAGPTPRAAVTAIHGDKFSLSVDEHTNVIIALAAPEVHQQIEQLIQSLDRRRPQVLVEVTLVSINASSTLDLGVELEQLELGEAWNHLLFTSFGLTTIDPSTGQRRLTPMPGGTGVLLGPDQVPIIVQALATRGDTHVYSAPRILVDDNATGRIESVSESPFTSVNASETIATTSFAGFAKAGTQLSIEPHIAEGDHLEINYTLTVSSFTGSGTGTAPPPRSSDTMSSTIRVPDGHTVIVGGLLTETLGDSTSQVPLIGDVPVLGWLFGSRSNSKSKVRLYAFIRPTVLREDRFEDLKYLSAKELKAAGVPDGWPPDRPQYMR